MVTNIALSVDSVQVQKSQENGRKFGSGCSSEVSDADADADNHQIFFLFITGAEEKEGMKNRRFHPDQQQQQ